VSRQVVLKERDNKVLFKFTCNIILMN